MNCSLRFHWHPVRSSAAVAHLLQGSTCCAFRDGILYTLVVTRGYLSYCCLSIISNQSAYSPLTSDINKAFSSTQLLQTLEMAVRENPSWSAVFDSDQPIWHQYIFIYIYIPTFYFFYTSCSSKVGHLFFYKQSCRLIRNDTNIYIYFFRFINTNDQTNKVSNKPKMHIYFYEIW